MHIKIAQRLHPYSHCPGAYCLLPGTEFRFQIFPSRLIVYELSQAEPEWVTEISLPVQGPVKDFTIELNLEKGCIRVWGFSQSEYFRYSLHPLSQANKFNLKIEKGLSSWQSELEEWLKPFSIEKNYSLPYMERLSLGNHKSQDWSLVKRRGDLTEILPTWHRLGQLFLKPQNLTYDGTASLLKVDQQTPEQIYHSLLNLFYTGFEGILSPRLTDTEYQGFSFNTPPKQMSPLFLLTEGTKVIRSLFFKHVENDFFILPSLPQQFHSGRFLHLNCDSLGLLDLEWSKKKIRRMIFRAEKNGSMNFHFSSDIKQFRLNDEIKPVGHPTEIESGKTYYFDRFQK